MPVSSNWRHYPGIQSFYKPALKGFTNLDDRHSMKIPEKNMSVSNQKKDNGVNIVRVQGKLLGGTLGDLSATFDDLLESDVSMVILAPGRRAFIRRGNALLLTTSPRELKRIIRIRASGGSGD